MTTQEPTAGVVNDHYRMEPGLSQFTVQAFAGGLLSFMAHSPTCAVCGSEGEMRWRPDAADAARLVLTVHRIRPVTAVGGAIQLRDQHRVSFDVGARKEAS